MKISWARKNVSGDRVTQVHQRYLSNRSVMVLPMSEEINPGYLSIMSSNNKNEMEREELTAIVPNIAPLAPSDGTPTREKFPPRTLLDKI